MGVVLFISSLLLLPGQDFLAIGMEVLLLGLLDWIIVSFLKLKSLREMQPAYRRQLVPYIVFSRVQHSPS